MDAYGKVNSCPNRGCSSLANLLITMFQPTQLIVFVNLSLSVFNDGSTRDLMSLTGTVPVSYRGMVVEVESQLIENKI